MQSYAIVTNTAIHLFANLESIDEKVMKHLTDEGVELHPYNSFTKILEELPANITRICSKGKITVRDYKVLDIPGAKFMDDPTLGGTVNIFKAIKNNWEKDGFEKAYLADGVAWCKVLKYIDDALVAGEALKEYVVGKKFEEFR